MVCLISIIPKLFSQLLSSLYLLFKYFILKWFQLWNPMLCMKHVEDVLGYSNCFLRNQLKDYKLPPGHLCWGHHTISFWPAVLRVGLRACGVPRKDCSGRCYKLCNTTNQFGPSNLELGWCIKQRALTITITRLWPNTYWHIIYHADPQTSNLTISYFMFPYFHKQSLVVDED